MNDINNESFEYFLQSLSTNETEAGVAYTKLRDSLVRFFQLKGDAEPETAADETIDRVALKFSQNSKIDNLTKYSFGVARLVFLERLRRNQKEKNSHDGFYANKALFSADTIENDEFLFYRECFQSLPEPDRRFLERYFMELPNAQQNENRKKMIDEFGVSVNNLRLKIFRLRKRLNKCLQKKRKKK